MLLSFSSILKILKVVQFYMVNCFITCRDITSVFVFIVFDG